MTDTAPDSKREPLPTPQTSLEAREQLVDSLRLDLVGPGPDHELAEENLPRRYRPSNWYLTGFLIPSDTPPESRGDEDSDEDFEVAGEGGNAEENAGDRKAARKSFFPSSMGMTFLVPPEASQVTVTLTWGDYVISELPPRNEDDKPLPVWKRHPREISVSVPVEATSDGPAQIDLEGSGGVQLTVLTRSLDSDQLAGEVPTGTKSVSVFVVNHRPPAPGEEDTAYLFQPRLAVHCAVGFTPRPDPRGALAEEEDERIADLHFADAPEMAAGHGVSVDWQIVDGRCHEVWTEWIPRGDVDRTVTAKLESVELRMDVLGGLESAEAVRSTLEPLVREYRTWIEAQRAEAASLSGRRRDTAETLMHQAAIAAKRIQAGIEALAGDEDARHAFCVANRAVSRALKQRLPDVKEPGWRAFQLAFLLLNVEGIVEPENPRREIVDLLFFPTGGGKTEAYLGLAAFTMVLRRLRNPEISGAGVSVLMRYTLRLLTLDQLGRAAGLVCALELEREQDEKRLGTWPFEIGLWVGKAATPNMMGRKGGKGPEGDGSARQKTQRYQSDDSRNPSPIPLENCPWCGTKFTKDSFRLEPNADNPRQLRVSCVDPDMECAFEGQRSLPIIAVDEVIYRRLPAFLIATVDKFASLPFTGETGLLLGGATRQDSEGFYGPMDPGTGHKLAKPLPAPDLVIQDELHLITGPMGTMAGLYETALESLMLRGQDGDRPIRPKIVASTATARRAGEQVRALFARSTTQVFPPPGVSRRDSFFATMIVPDADDPARSYLGISAQGRNPKIVYRRLVTSVMAAAQNAYMNAGGFEEGNVVDPYMTVLSYFNSLRELGGSRRIIEEEVATTLKSYGRERSRPRDPKQRFTSRPVFNEPVELTSRVPTDRVAEAKRRLDTDHSVLKERVDCALATNMISVGLDITRLGLMVMVGQPKTHSEYIQASSRVGREASKPGLVLTVLNVHKPRDRSHYERFRHYHETFYRSVEASSVTPFSARALDRGLAGALVGLIRHLEKEMTPAKAPGELPKHVAELRARAIELFTRRVADSSDGYGTDDRQREVRNRIEDLMDSWMKVIDDWTNDGKQMGYQKYEPDSKGRKPLVREMLDSDPFSSDHHRKFRANRSLRDVEPQVQVELVESVGNPNQGDDRG